MESGNTVCATPLPGQYNDTQSVASTAITGAGEPVGGPAFKLETTGKVKQELSAKLGTDGFAPLAQVRSTSGRGGAEAGREREAGRTSCRGSRRRRLRDVHGARPSLLPLGIAQWVARFNDAVTHQKEVNRAYDELEKARKQASSSALGRCPASPRARRVWPRRGSRRPTRTGHSYKARTALCSDPPAAAPQVTAQKTKIDTLRSKVASDPKAAAKLTLEEANMQTLGGKLSSERWLLLLRCARWCLLLSMRGGASAGCLSCSRPHAAYPLLTPTRPRPPNHNSIPTPSPTVAENKHQTEEQAQHARLTAINRDAISVRKALRTALGVLADTLAACRDAMSPDDMPQAPLPAATPAGR